MQVAALTKLIPFFGREAVLVESITCPFAQRLYVALLRAYALHFVEIDCPEPVVSVTPWDTAMVGAPVETAFASLFDIAVVPGPALATDDATAVAWCS